MVHIVNTVLRQDIFREQLETMLNRGVNLFGNVCRISETLGTLGLHWDAEKQQLTLASEHSKQSSSRSYQHLKLLNYVHSVTCVLIGLQCVLAKDRHISNKALEIIALSILQCTSCHLHTIRTRATDIKILINGHFQYTQMYGKFDKSPEYCVTEKISYVFAKLFAFTGLAFPVAVTLLHMINPNMATIPGYWLFKENVTVTQVLLFVYKLEWTWKSSIMMLIFTCVFINGLLLLTVCLSNMALVYKRSKRMQLKRKVWDSQTDGMERSGRTFEKFWRSYPVHKIKFAACNYAEELTPLNSLDFAVNLTVQFLLLAG